MIRQPSSFRRLHQWHRDTLDGHAPPRHETEAHCGWYKRRRVKNGPWVPARIFVERDICPETGELLAPETLRIEVEGLDAGDPLDHWTYLVPISHAEFEHLMDYRLRDPRMFNGRTRIDLSDTPTEPQGVF